MPAPDSDPLLPQFGQEIERDKSQITVSRPKLWLLMVEYGQFGYIQLPGERENGMK
jgi:hypothetical protein